MGIPKTLSARELLRQTEGIPSFADFNIPDYTEREFLALSLNKRVVEAIRIQNRDGLETSMVNWSHEVFLQRAHLSWPELVVYVRTVRTWGEHFDFCKKRWPKDWARMVQVGGVVTWERPYFTNNFRPYLEAMWKGESFYYDGIFFPKKLLKLVASYKKKSGWVELPRFDSRWDNQYIIYPMYVELERRGFHDLSR